jgi:hypothetical protein
MPSLGKTVFKGQSGTPYRFKVFPLGTRFRQRSGVFVVANRSRDDDGHLQHSVLFVGHTEDFSHPLDGHAKAGDFAEEGANCICVQSDEKAASREKTEKDLVKAFSPKCNG